MDDELRFHIQEQIEAEVARGVAREVAESNALRRFGDVTAIRARCVEIDDRVARRASLANRLAGFVQDAAFAARTLRRRPVFAATMLLTLTLGIGATASMFSVINGVLLRDLPYRDPGQLVSIHTTFPQWRGQPILGDLWNTLRTPYPDYVRIVSSQRSFTGIAGFQYSDASLRVGEGTASIAVGDATANLLSVLGVATASGRWFSPGEDGPTAQRVAVLSHELWQARFGGRAILDSTIVLDEDPFRVIGILPRGFELAARQIQSPGAETPELWIPFGVYPGSLRAGNHTLELIGRLRPGVSIAAATVDIEPLVRGDRSPATRGARLVARAEAETSEVRRPLLLLFAAVGLLLLITCGNVAMLFLSECVVRDHELRTRALLGAGRARLVRLLLTESAVIAVSGAVLGSVLAWWGTRVMLAMAPRELPHAAMVHLDLRVCLFTAAIAVVVALISGAIPAMTLTRGESSRTLTQSRVAAGRSRLQTFVIALQAAMSIVLMGGAGLLSRSLLNQQRTNPGFRPDNILSVRLELPRALDRTADDRRATYATIADRLASIPGVAAVTAMSTPPLGGRTNGQAVSPRPEEKLTNSSASAERAVIFPNYFDVLRIPLQAGRNFTALDVNGSLPVAIVSEGFARRFWPGEPAVGKQFRSPQGVLTIVGVVGDVKNTALDRTPEALYYLPAGQGESRLSFLIATSADRNALASRVVRTIWSAAPGATITEVASLDDFVDKALAPGRYRALLSSLFAAMALLLTAVGVAGLIARGVATRLRELCVRMAVGATPRAAFTLAARRGLGAVGVGVVAGLVIMPVTSRWLAEYLYEVRAGDGWTMLATIVATMSVCVVATLFATRRLRRVDLASILRES